MEQFTDLQLGNHFTTNCITKHPELSVLWLANGLNISNSNRLMIPSLQPYHNYTNYTCVVSIQQNLTGCPQNQSKKIVIRLKCKEYIMIILYYILC